MHHHWLNVASGACKTKATASHTPELLQAYQSLLTQLYLIVRLCRSIDAYCYVVIKFFPRHERCIQTAMLISPFAKCGTAHAMVSAEFRNRHTVFDLFQYRHYLAISIFRFFHAACPAYSLRDNSTFDVSYFSGDYPQKAGDLYYHSYRLVENK